jgi:hypothetical protein
MTTEERFTRIENILQSVVETHARHEMQFEKQNAGIRDLVVVSRTLIEAQQRTDSNVNRLAGTVDQLSHYVDQLSRYVDQLSRDVSALLKSLRKPNGNR